MIIQHLVGDKSWGVVVENLTFMSPPIQTSILALERQMRSRWLCFWKRSGAPDCNLNKYPIHGGNASGVWGQSYINKGQRM